MRPNQHFSTSPLAGQGTRKSAPAGQPGAVRATWRAGRSPRRDSLLHGACGKKEPQAKMARVAHGDGACNMRGEALAGTEGVPTKGPAVSNPRTNQGRESARPQGRLVRASLAACPSRRAR